MIMMIIIIIITVLEGEESAEELSLDYDFDDSATVLRNGDKEMREGDKEQQKVKSIINKANPYRHMKDLQNQPWVGKSVGIFGINCFLRNLTS